MGRPKKVTFADQLDIYLQTCSESELEGVEAAVRIWRRVRTRTSAAPDLQTKQQAALPLQEEK